MQFAVAHVPGSIHIVLTGQYASWAARILGLDTPLIITGEDPEQVRESQTRLARVGIENVAGFLVWSENRICSIQTVFGSDIDNVVLPCREPSIPSDSF
jgi:hypothetical protein